jgi:hypothetical protein
LTVENVVEEVEMHDLNDENGFTYYPPRGVDPVLDWMRDQGLPDPGTPEAEAWVHEHIEGVIEDSPIEEQTNDN